MTPLTPNINENMQIASRDLRSHPNAALTPAQLDAVLDNSRGGDRTFRPHLHRLWFCLFIIAATAAFVAASCAVCNSIR